MFALLLLSASAAWAGAFVDVGTIEVEGTATSAIQDARTALAAGRFDDAAALYGALADAGGGARARVAQAVALYEAGYVRAARRAAEQAIALSPKDVDAACILGLSLVDGGQVDDGIERLRKAKELAHAAGDGAGEGRAAANLGLAYVDQGRKDEAAAAFSVARPLASAAGDAATLATIADGEAALAALSGDDDVGELLGKGQVSAARSTAQGRLDRAKTRREKLDAGIELASVDRAAGRLNSAAGRLEGLVKEARETGMSRELAVSLGNLGLVYSLTGRLGLAADTLTAAANEAHAGGYRVIEADVRSELGLVLVHLDRAGEAKTQQYQVGALLAQMNYPQGMARQAELGGAVAAATGDLSTANEALSSTVDYFVREGRSLDAARAATSLSAAWQASDTTRAESWGRRATDLFAKAGEPLGPAHVALARGLAAARAKKLDDALHLFATAADLAKAQGGDAGTALASVARDDAAQTLVALGSSADVARLSAEAGLADIVEHEQKLQVGSAAYDAGLSAYNGGRFDEAKAQFQLARQTFDQIGETAYAARARTAAAWSVYNQLAGMATSKAAPSWQALVEEAAKVGDAELYARAYGAAVLAAQAVGQTSLGQRFDECVRLATNAGLLEVAAHCHAGLAQGEGDLDSRARHARLALQLAPTDSASAYALYSVAVDAYNGGRNDLATEMARAALPIAGELRASVQAVLDAAGAP